MSWKFWKMRPPTPDMSFSVCRDERGDTVIMCPSNMHLRLIGESKNFAVFLIKVVPAVKAHPAFNDASFLLADLEHMLELGYEYRSHNNDILVFRKVGAQ